MKQIKYIINEKFISKRKPEDIFAAVFLSNAAALTEQEKPSIIEYTDQSPRKVDGFHANRPLSSRVFPQYLSAVGKNMSMQTAGIFYSTNPHKV